MLLSYTVCTTGTSMCSQFLYDSNDLFSLFQLDKEDEDSEFEDEDDPDFYQLAHMPI